MSTAAEYSDFEALSLEAAHDAVANLKGIHRDQIKKVLSTKFRSGSKAGDGMTSVIKVVDIEYEYCHADEEKEVTSTAVASVMGKFSVSSGSVSAWWDEMHLFEREMEFYEKLMPKFKQVYRDYFPESYSNHPFVDIYHCKEGEKLFLMEDLKAQKFKLCHDDDESLTNKLNPTQMLHVLKELALFHAVGYHVLAGDYNSSTSGSLMEQFAEHCPWIGNAGKLGQFMTDNDEVKKQTTELYIGLTKKMVPLLRKSSDISKEVVDRFEKFIPKAGEVVGLGRSPDNRKLLVIAHGDFWSNNILFKYGSGGADKDAITAMKMIDFQECMLSRPTTDLACLFSTSTHPTLRQEHLHQWLKFYHTEFVKQMTVLGHGSHATAYKLEDLFSDYKDNYGHGFYWGIMNAQSSMSSDGNKLASLLVEHDTSKSQEEEKAVEKKEVLEEDAEAVAPTEGEVRIVALVKEAAEFGLF